MPDMPPPIKKTDDKNQAPVSKSLAIFGVRLLNPKTPVGHKLQGFIAGAAFVYLLSFTKMNPDQVRNCLQMICMIMLNSN